MCAHSLRFKMAEDKDTNKDYVEFIEIDGDNSNSTIIVKKISKTTMKSRYDPKTTMPIPCPYKALGVKVAYHVNSRVFQVVDSKGNRIQPIKQRSSRFALSSASKPN